MDIQKLFELIERVEDHSSALTVPSYKALINYIQEWDIATRMYSYKDVADCIDTLRNNQYGTVTEKRNITEQVLRRIVEVVCEGTGLDMVKHFTGSSRTLHVGIVERQTHTGYERVYGIRDCSPDDTKDPVWEYLPTNSSSLLAAIAWRSRSPNSISIYGYHDHLDINKPVVHRDDIQGF